MLKKIMVLTFLIILLPIESFADTITATVGNVPIQESYNSQRVIETLPAGATLTMTGKQGAFYKVKYGNITGWVNMGYTDQGDTLNLPPNADFVDYARERKEYVRKHGYTYSQNVSKLFCPLDKNKSREVDCSTYVCDVLVNYGMKKGCSDLANMGRFSTLAFKQIGDSIVRGIPAACWNNSNIELTQYFSLVPSFSQARPGDILLFNGHVEIYAGNGMVYSCGSPTAIKADGLVTYMDSRPIVYIFRVK